MTALLSHGRAVYVTKYSAWVSIMQHWLSVHVCVAATQHRMKSNALQVAE